MKRKFTLLLTMLLMLGAGSSWAEAVKVYSSSFGSSTCYSEGVYTSAQNYSNLMSIMEFTAGDLSSYSEFTIVVSNFTKADGTSGGAARIRFASGSDTEVKQITIYSGGTKTFKLHEKGTDENGVYYLGDVDLSSVNKVMFGGGGSGDNVGCKATFGTSNVYLTHKTLTRDDVSSPINITSADDWGALKALVEGSFTSTQYSDMNAKLTNSFSVTSTIGTSAKPYSGTFNGNGNTLSFSYSGTGSYIAPFAYVEDATIQNLNTTGSIESSGNLLAGVVSTASGTCVIESCECSMAIISNLASGESNSGGIVGITIADANLTVNNCIFSGSITVNKPGAEKTKRYCGIVGYLRTPSTSHIISNCLNIGTISGEGLDTGTNSSNVIYRAGGTTTPSNNYYLNDWGDESARNATLVTNEQLNSGEVAYNLQGNQATQYWGQSNLNKSTAESLPKLTSTAADKVIKISFYNGSAVVYANYNGPYNAVAKNALSFYSGGAETANYGPYTTDVTVSRSVSKYILNVSSAGATTLVLPGKVSSLPANVKAYKLTYTSGDKVTAEEVTSITANEPVLINAPEGQYVLTTDNTGPDITYDKENAHQNGALYGVYTDTYKYVPANSYVLQNGAEGLGFYKVAAEKPIKITSFRAYLTAQAEQAEPAEPESSLAPRLSIVYNNNTTGINSVREQTNNDDAIYTLTGIKVEHPTSGIYIKNGKKYYVK